MARNAKLDPELVIDTNVFLDVFSCHDLQKAHLDLPDADLNHPRLVFRRARAREGLLLAVLLHHRRSVSWTLREAELQLKQLVPPGDAAFTRDYVAVILHLVKDRILGEWTDGLPSRLKKNEPRGNDADDAYVAFAKKNRIPLVSNEGYTERGMRAAPPKRPDIRDKAAAVGVRVHTARDYYRASGRNPDADIAWFLRRYTIEAPDYVAENPNTKSMVETVHGIYRLFLLGEAEGRAEPLLVEVPDRATS